MDQDLERLLEEKRQQRCPVEVIRRVNRERSLSRRHGAWRPGIVLGSAAALLVWGASHLWPPSSHHPQLVKENVDPEPEVLLQETYLSLSFIGKALLKGSESGRRIIANEALPPLKRGFEETKETIRRNL